MEPTLQPFARFPRVQESSGVTETVALDDRTTSGWEVFLNFGCFVQVTGGWPSGQGRPGC